MTSDWPEANRALAKLETLTGELTPPAIANAQTVYERMSLEDRLEVCSPCFQEGSFDWKGNIDMVVRGRGKLAMKAGLCKQHKIDYNSYHPINCAEEYLCEVLAAFILMPFGHFNQQLDWIRQTWRPEAGWDPVEYLAKLYQVEHWAVRFRTCLMDENFFDPYRWATRVELTAWNRWPG